MKKMDRKTLHRQYDEKLKRFRNLQTAAHGQLHHAINGKRIKIHSLSSRLKDFDSFAEKAVRKNLTDPFSQIRDVLGFRVICLFLSDLPKVGEVVKDTFKLIDENNKIDGRPKNVFGYMDIQYVVALKDNAPNDMLGVPFEIQVRTIAQDAWASVSHHLAYKQPDAIPEEWQRDFQALSALFYVADQHFRILLQQTMTSLSGNGTAIPL